MEAIRDKWGNVVRRSKNLRVLIVHLGKCRYPIERLDIAHIGNGEGKLSILWSNGESFETTFADFSVLSTWVKSRRNLRGVPLSVDGFPQGVIARDNPPEEGAWILSGEYRPNRNTSRWTSADSIGGMIGYSETEYRFSGYMVDIKAETIRQFRDARAEWKRRQSDLKRGRCPHCHGTGKAPIQVAS